MSETTKREWELSDKGLLCFRDVNGDVSFDIFEAENYWGSEKEGQEIAKELFAAVNAHSTALALAEAVLAVKGIGVGIAGNYRAKLEELASQFQREAGVR